MLYLLYQHGKITKKVYDNFYSSHYNHGRKYNNGREYDYDKISQNFLS